MLTSETYTLSYELKSPILTGFFSWHHGEAMPTPCPWESQRLRDVPITEFIRKSGSLARTNGFRRPGRYSSWHPQHPWWGKATCSHFHVCLALRALVSKQALKKQGCVRLLGETEPTWFCDPWIDCLCFTLRWVEIRLQLLLRINLCMGFPSSEMYAEASEEGWWNYRCRNPRFWANLWYLSNVSYWSKQFYMCYFIFGKPYGVLITSGLM